MTSLLGEKKLVLVQVGNLTRWGIGGELVGNWLGIECRVYEGLKCKLRTSLQIINGNALFCFI